MTTVRRIPPLHSLWVSGGVALIAMGTSGFYSWVGLGVGMAGIIIHVIGLIRGSNRSITIGAFALLTSSLIAGTESAPVVPILVSATCSVLAWDIGRNAISIGNQLGRTADTRRIEAVHIVASSAVGVTSAGVGYGLYQFGSNGQPIAALVFLLIAAVLLVEALA